jgi:S1-C subfamily serine protease
MVSGAAMPDGVIARPSIASLLILMSSHGRQLGSGTAFVVEQDGLNYLVTNRHNLAGRGLDNQPLDSSGAVPDTVTILHNMAAGLGQWRAVPESLLDAAGLPLWFEHPDHGRRVDVVALPLTNLADVQLYPYKPSELGPLLAAGVSGDVSIVGFPFGMTAGGAFGVWSRGAIASEMAVDFDDLPLFLVDSRTRPGQSGSPVIIYASGGMVAMENGDSAVFGGPVERLLGVYSGRVNDQSDLGFVWKVQVVIDIIAARARRPSFP